VQVIAGIIIVRFLTPDMASGYINIEQIDAMSGIVFCCHAWRQKADKLHTCNHLPNFRKRAFSCDNDWLQIASALCASSLLPKCGKKHCEYYNIQDIMLVDMSRT